jgi:ElaB/YqjD/DUF883 family membrane-anchored ribosome-binding protein
MAKKDKKKMSTPQTAAENEAAPTPTSQERQEDVAGAAEHLQFAREQLRQAEACYEEIKEKAAEQVQQLRETTLGDVVNGALDFVKKHPGAGVMGAATIGFLIGRITRR